MAVQEKDIMILGANVAPEDSTTTGVGGAIESAAGFAGGYLKCEFENLAATEQVKVFSENAADTMNLTITYRTAGGAIASEVKALTGKTVGTTTASMERLMKASLASAPAGHVAIFGTTVTKSGTAQAGTVDTIQLASAAITTDGELDFHVIRITGGTGIDQVREIKKSTATDDTCYVRDWTVTPDATSTYEIYAGMVFEQDIPIGECKRMFYDSSAAAPGGSNKTLMEKYFIKNTNATKDLTNAQLAEGSGGASAKIAFDLETSLDGSDSSGASNRENWTGGSYSFDSATKAMGASGDGNLTAGAAQGIWLELTLNAGDAASKSFYPFTVTGQST